MDAHLIFFVDDPAVQKILEGSFVSRGLTVVSQPPAAGRAIHLAGLTPETARRLVAALPLPGEGAPGGIYLAAQQAVTDAFVGNGSAREVTARVARALGQSLGFDFVTVWTCTPPATRIACADVWTRAPERHGELRALTQGVSFAPGTDVTGRVWETGQSEWLEEVGVSSAFLRAPVAARSGLSSALVVRFRGADRTSGVLEMLSEAPRPRDERSLKLVEHVAEQLGAYLERLARQESRGLLAAAVEATHEVVAVLDRDGAVLDVNDAGRRLLGLAATASPAGRALPQPDYARRYFHDVALPHALSDGSWTGETALDDPQHGELSALTELVAHRGPDGAVRHVFATFRGIDELVSGKRKAWQAEKLEALARMAGAIANDFNNLLTVITGYSNLVADSLDAEDARREQLAQLDQASQQAGVLIHQLLTIGAQPPREHVAVDLWAMLHDMTRLIRSLAGPGVEVMLIRETAESLVVGDPLQLEQIVVSLVANARDALQRGGRITIGISSAKVAPGTEPGDRSLPAGTYVVLAVTDTGVGMDSATQARLFEPFFSTKAGARGLGLASVLGTARQAGGQVIATSQPGHGSTFRVYLPRSEVSTVPVQAPQLAYADLTGNETVLVVDDEPGVRALARRALERSGYRVLEAEHGTGALDVCRTHTGPIHLALLDVVMPGPGGGELARRALELRPSLTVLFMTGHSGSVVALQRDLPPGTSFLEKPFVPAMLLRAVRTALDRKSGRPVAR